MTTDSPLAATFVAAPDHWSRNGAAIKGIVVHMAEGGGTVSWLTRPDGNSSHYVVEYSGRIVQMVREARAAGSINPRSIRETNDTAYTYLGEVVRYGRTAVLNSIGKAAGNDPNRFVIAIETEGFAKEGPNAKQRAALAALVNDIRRRNGAQPTLGHRDFQDYKPCPGHRIPWVDYGGHAKSVEYVPPPPVEESVNSYPVPKEPSVGDVAAGTWLYVSDSLSPHQSNIQIDPKRSLPYLGQPSSAVRIVEYVDAGGVHSGRSYFVKAGELTNIRALPKDCSAETAPLEAQVASYSARLAKINDLSKV